MKNPVGMIAALFAVAVTAFAPNAQSADDTVAWHGKTDPGKVVWRHVKNGGKRYKYALPVEKYTRVVEVDTIKMMYSPPGDGRYLEKSHNRCDGWFMVQPEQAGTWAVAAGYDDYIAIGFDGKWLVRNSRIDVARKGSWTATPGLHKFTLVFGDTGGTYGNTGRTRIPYSVAISVNGGNWLPFDDMVKAAASGGSGIEKRESKVENGRAPAPSAGQVGGRTPSSAAGQAGGGTPSSATAANGVAAAKSRPDPDVDLPPVRIRSIEEAGAAFRGSGRNPRAKRSFPLVPPVADEGFLDNVSPRGAIANVREMIRELVGPLEGEDARLFEAKWNAVMDFPTQPIVEWLKKASPIVSEMVRIKSFIEEATSDFTDLVDEANRARMFGAFEDAERLMAEAEDIVLSMKAAQDRMAVLKAKLEELGEMPDPVEEKKAAAERRKAAAKTMKDLFGGTVQTRIGGWYKAAGMTLAGSPPIVNKKGKTVGEEPRWKFEKPQERIYIRPLFKYADSGIVVVYVNRYEGGAPDMNLMTATEGPDGSLSIMDGLCKTELSMIRDERGDEYLSVKKIDIVLKVSVSTTLYKYDGGADLKMLPDSKKDNAVDISVFDNKNPEKAKGKYDKIKAEAFGKIYADKMKDELDAFRKRLDSKLNGSMLGEMPYAKDIYYVLSGMEYSEADAVKPLDGGAKDVYGIVPADDHYKTMISKLGGSGNPQGTRQLVVQKGMFRCDVKRIDQVWYGTGGRRTTLDSGTAEIHVRWTPPSLLFRASGNKYSMTFWPKIGISPLKHGKMKQRLRITCRSGQVERKEFVKEFDPGETMVKATCGAAGQGWIDPELTVEFAISSLMEGNNEFGDYATMAVRCKYRRMVLTEEEAAQLARDMAGKYRDAMRKEWSSQKFGETAKQVDDYVAALKSEEDAAVAAVNSEEDRLAHRKERMEFHNENIKFIDGTISRLKAEMANEKDESRRKALKWQIVCEESNKIYEQDRIREEETGEFHASRTPFDNMCAMQVFESALKEVNADRLMRKEQARLEAFVRTGSQFKLPPEQRQRVERLMDEVDVSDPIKAAIAYRKISDNLLKSDVNATMSRTAMLEDESLKYEDLLLRAQRVKLGCDITLALGGIAISGGVAAGELAPIMATKFNVLKYTYAIGCGYAESGPKGIVKGVITTYSDVVDIVWSGVDGYYEGKKALKKGEKVNPWLEAVKGAGWSLFMNKGLPKIMEKVNWRKQITFGKVKSAAPKIDVDTPDVKAYKAEVAKAQNEISAYVRAKNAINTMSEFDLASGKITDAQITKLRMNVVKTAAKINANPTAKAILKYEQGYGKIGKDFNLELGRIHAAVRGEFYKDMAAKGFQGLKINAIRNASSGKSVGMDSDWGIDENMKITRNGKPVSVYECMTEGQKSWNAKYKAVTGQDAEHFSWENITSHAHPEAYRNMDILKLDGSDARMRNLLNRTSLADAQQIADVTRFKADSMLKGDKFPRLVYLREAARGSAKDMGGKFLPAIESKMKPLVRLERMAGKHGKALTPGQQHELNRLRAAHDYYSKVYKVFDDIGKGKIPPGEWDARISEITGGRGISDTLGDLGDLFKSLVL